MLDPVHIVPTLRTNLWEIEAVSNVVGTFTDNQAVTINCRDVVTY